jgi:outer membrane protein assembly factor BamB
VNGDSRPRRGWVRLILAWAITFGALPYLWGRTLILSMMVGQPAWPWAGLLAAVIAVVMVLTWTTRPPGRGIGLLLGWLAANVLLLTLFAVPQMPLWQLLGVFVPSTVWVVWLAWLGAWPLSWPARLVLLALWLALGVVGPMRLAVPGLTGDRGVIFAWRTPRDAPLTVATAPTGERIELTPTPDDFAQFLGPRRLAVLPNVKIAGDWTASPPRELWRRRVGEGWSAFAVVGGYAFTQEQRGEQECVTCYRLRDGEPVWVHADTARIDGLGGPGPRATPTVDGGKVYAVGATGLLNCLDGATGQRLWSVNILADHGAGNIEHGVCASPLVDGERVIVCPTGEGGPSLAAYHRDTGRKLWSAGTDQASYGSPLFAELGGVRQILLATSEGVAGHDAADGRPLWRFEWTNHVQVNCGQPLAHAGRPDGVLFATGYSMGAVLFTVDRSKDGAWSAEQVWGNRNLKATFTTPVLYDGFVYGLDDGILTCLDPKTGQRRWKDGRYGHGQVLLAGDRLIVQTEGGPVVLVEPSSEGLKERGRIEALSSKTWCLPVLVGRLLLLRNDREAVCYELPAP